MISRKIFILNFLKNKKVDVNPELFELLAKRISSLFEYKKKNYLIKDGDLINLESSDLVKMEEEFGKENLVQNFIEFDKSPLTFKEYLRGLLFDGYNATDYKINFIRASLDARIRRDIEKELIYREGFKRGYGNLPEVKKEFEIWKEYYLFQYLMDQFKDSVIVSDDEIYSYYLKNNQPETYPMLVNIIEILTDSIKTADSILEKIKTGADFKTLRKEI